MFTRLFWKDTVERVVRTAAGGVLAVFAGEGADTADAGDLKTWAVFVGIPSLVSLCLALVSAGKDATISPASLVNVTPPEQPAYTPEGN